MATKKQKSPEPKEALDDIEEMIVCYLCESRAVPDQPRWYRCIQLHLVCQSCKSEYTIPICKCGGRILETPCGIINAILKNARKRSQCAHAYLGCKEIPDDDRQSGTLAVDRAAGAHVVESSGSSVQSLG